MAYSDTYGQTYNVQTLIDHGARRCGKLAEELTSEQVLSYSFNGETGLNKFTFSQYVQEDIFNFSLFKRDSDGNFMDTTGILELYPSLSGAKTGNFITGIQILNSGIYSGVPIVNFDSYSGIYFDLEFVDVSIQNTNFTFAEYIQVIKFT